MATEPMLGVVKISTNVYSTTVDVTLLLSVSTHVVVSNVQHVLQVTRRVQAFPSVRTLTNAR